MSDDGPVPIRLTLNKDGVTAPVLRAMRISTDMVRIGLHGIATADPSNTAVHEGFFTLNFEPREDPEKLRETYRAWLLAKGFQELARGLRQTLEEAFQYATLASVLPKLPQPTTGAVLNSLLGETRKKANALPFPVLLKAVAAQLHTALDFGREFQSMQDVRNCLEHRDGIVGDADVETNSATMKLRLPRLKVYVERAGEEVEVAAGTRVQRGENIIVSTTFREREWQLGSRVTFSPEEFQEIALACWHFANDIGTKLPDVKPRVDQP